MKASKNMLVSKEKKLVSSLMHSYQAMGDIQSKLKTLLVGTIEKMLEAEMEEHLGYEKHSVEGNNSGNSRNGYNRKEIISKYGKSVIAVPRDRNGQFRPKVLGRHQTNTGNIEQKILTLYAKSMKQQGIEENLHEIYGADIPPTLIAKITDKILPEVDKWQNRPLKTIYPIVYFDTIVFNSPKESQLFNKSLYCVLGIDIDNQRDILGIWLGENENANFYASICADLKKRGVSDIFIAYHDNLKNLKKAINTVFPKQ